MRDKAFRKFQAEKKVKRRLSNWPTNDSPLKRFLADTPKRCSHPFCCGNRRAYEGPTIQELRQCES